MNQDRIKTLKEALGAIEQLAIPEHLQEVALQYILSGAVSGAGQEATANKQQLAVIPPKSHSTTTHNLREYVASLNLKTAVTEIPALLYWAASNEQLSASDEKGILELYRRAGLRPPKNISQSLRDLSSKRYGRLESVGGQPGFFKLSRAGEDFVIFDVIEKNKK